jgi:glycerol-3-phosphate acyltransferase PlsX
MKLGIDILGGDKAPEVTVEGAILAFSQLPSTVKIVLIGDESIILNQCKKNNFEVSNFEIVHAPDIISYNDHPTKALASKPNSSIAVGFNLLKEGKINAFSSAGNTGAMMVGAMFSVNCIPGIQRPCITAVLPKLDGSIGILLDVGTNPDCKPEILYQYAMLGSIYFEHVHKKSNPKVGLLSIGEEAEKGNINTIATHKLMKGTRDFNFIGNVEGRDFFNDKADVIVADGFTGNVVLKQAESTYYLLKKRNIKDDYFDRFNYELYGGTPILGINGTVMIGHGISNAIAIKNMIIHSLHVAEAKIPEKIAEVLSKVSATNE